MIEPFLLRKKLTMRLITLFLLLSFSLTLQAQIPTDSLVVHYPFNGNALDMSGNGNDGIVVDAVLTNDRFGNPNSAYYCDGSGDYIIIDGSADVLTQYSIAVWFRTSTLSWGSSFKVGVIFSGNHATSNRLGRPNIHVEDSDNTLRTTGGYTGTDYNEVSTSPGIADGQWHFAVGTYDEATDDYELYADGQYIGSANGSVIPLNLENLGTPNNNLTLGFRNGNTQYWEGELDDFRIYERILTPCEVLALYNESQTSAITSATWQVCDSSLGEVLISPTLAGQSYQLVDTNGALSGSAIIADGDSITLVTDTLLASSIFQVVVTDTASGCSQMIDSMFTFEVLTNDASITVDTVLSCGSYTWTDGTTYLSSTTLPLDTLLNIHGCDSVVNLDLTVQSVDTSVTVISPTIISNAIGATYEWFECDSPSVVLGSSPSYSASANGTYAVAVTQGGCVDTSACIPIVIVGRTSASHIESFTLYPVPTAEFLMVETEDNIPYAFSILNSLGKVIQQGTSTTSTTRIGVGDLPAGIYSIRIEKPNASASHLFIKR